ncbi:UDP pyrophosphate phosphatase [Devosia sp. Root436]|uniref:undecaprenyl-diphosphate phosphatase n=1 Tax=Devosia sp. Root436 TaxID=1736537 RepID=UPI0006F28709|nr:undecaprenyl-diphosphate phosphatase [Devosia sp. Root436]KQX38663.1 UDP pyrophosphate phosphatase [Devosia sp. Root436]
MNADQGLFVPLILGILEGLTEFLPVSSTGHLLLAGHFFGLSQPATFIVLIQLGAILAVITVYFAKLGMLIRDALTGKAYAWQFALAVILACLPAVVAGVLLRDFIQGDLWESAQLICWTLLIGGVILLVVDRLKLTPKYDDIYHFPWHLALIVGLFQMLSLVPGVSRSGSTVVGAMLFGASKRAAAEFTFFIALPIMIGAFGYDLYKSRELIDTSLALNVGVGFAAAFIVGALVVRYLLGFVGKYGFAPFAWWRIAVGAAGLVAIYMLGR